MLPHGWRSNQTLTFSSPGINKNPSINDKPHAVILVIPAERALHENYLTRLAEFIDVANTRDIRVLLVLSKCDLYDPEVGRNAANITKSTLIANIIAKIIREKTGLEVLPYIAYTFGEVNPTMNYFSINVLDRALNLCEDYFEKKYNAILA